MENEPSENCGVSPVAGWARGQGRRDVMTVVRYAFHERKREEAKSSVKKSGYVRARGKDGLD